MANDLSAFVPEIWSKIILENLKAKLVMGNLVEHRYDGEIAEMGDQVHIPVITDVAVGDKTKGGIVSYENLASTTVDVLINKHKYVAFMIDDIEKIQANQDMTKAYTDGGAYKLAKTIDTDIFALYSGLTQSVGTAGTDITDAVLRNAIQKLDDADVPEEDRYLVIAPSQKNALLGIDKFVDASTRGDNVNPIVKGYFGNIYGLDIYVTTQVPQGVGTPACDYNLLFYKQAFACPIQRKIRTQADYDIDYLATKVVGDVVYGVKILRDSAAVIVKS